jgi:hypothetical protein
MADKLPDDLLAMVQANDKLLKALITLLAFRDEHLLPEMRIIFAGAGSRHSPIGEADAQTWTHVRRELAMIVKLVDAMAAEEEAAMKAEATEMH